MTLKQLQMAKTTAMKANDTEVKKVLTNMIDAVQKAAITPKGRVEITEQLCDETLIKYQKSIQEQIDTCPTNRVDLLCEYLNELAIVKQYAPQLLTDKDAIKARVKEIAGAAVSRSIKQTVAHL